MTKCEAGCRDELKAQRQNCLFGLGSSRIALNLKVDPSKGIPRRGGPLLRLQGGIALVVTNEGAMIVA